MTLHTPLWMQPGGADADITPTAQEFRQFLAAMMGISSISGQGVFTSTDCLVVQRGAGANFSVDVPAGLIAVAGDDVTAQGTYFLWNDGTVNVSTWSTGGAISAPGSGTRTHRLVCQIRDKLHNGTYSTYDAQFQMLQDPGTGLPAEPGSAISLASVVIAAGQVSITNANITDLRPNIANAAWRTMSLQAGWTNGTPSAKYRRAANNKLEIIGDIFAGTIADGTQIAAALPSSWRPAVTQSLKVITLGNSASPTVTPRLNLAADGTLTVQGLPAGTDQLRFNETISLDVT